MLTFVVSFFTFADSNSYVWGLVFLPLGVSISYVLGLVFLYVWGLVILTFGG